MNGSALPFVRLMECAGTLDQELPAARLDLLHPIEAYSADGFARLEPVSKLSLALAGADAAAPPLFALAVAPEPCRRELIDVRAVSCSGQGGVTVAEASRHAMLNALDSLALVPARIVGRDIEHHADAALRCALLRALVADQTSFCLTGLSFEALDLGDSLARPS